jgi:hypothetical protein
MSSILVKEIISILMESSFYFDLNLRERHSLVKHLILTFPLRVEHVS